MEPGRSPPGNGKEKQNESEGEGEGGFDICPRKQGGGVVLKPSLLAKNREVRRGSKSGGSKTVVLLGPGMVLLKGYLQLSDQQKIVEKCRELGVGSGGFYHPGYGQSKMHLKMMCLGKNWDPETGQYGDHRPFDGAKPPQIPPEFHHLVSNALAALPPDTPNPFPLPSIAPDICIVNFYSQTGRLGLHQDKDESEDSLRQGFPVVSFSIGDSADFLYSDHRDLDQPHKLLLNSGDVLIFGGPSRLIFHGVSVVHPNTAPALLLQNTNLRPGRLNLTFRHY
ncbi:hypothetical protein VNO78_13289 [Psophocarpus tetragonolobus]|uniref:Fe2OG dioxygenase domain-containing protein n=1 Tax=Psophocarpus tetragonolobus TaxID=3891 RepID=A0AAN9XPG9_PSOTE